MKPGLMVDLDGVLYQWDVAVYTELVVHWGYTGTYEDFWKCDCNKQSKIWWDSMCSLAILYNTQVPRKEDMQLLNDLAEKYEIFYITNRPLDVKTATIHYLNAWNFPNKENLLFTKNKGAVCSSLGIEIGLEDQVHNCKSMLDAGMKNVIMIRRDWNEATVSEICDEVTLINDFSEVRGLLL